MTGVRLPRSRRGTLIVAVVAAVVVVAVVVGVLVATSGPSSPGDVTFAAAGTETTTGPSQWCDIGVTDCADDPDATARLAVPPGAPLAVTVPEEVAGTPWQVVFSARDVTGAEQQGRSAVLAPGSPPTYTLSLPDPRLRLTSVEVQQYGARVGEGADGLEFVTRTTWVLGVE